MRLLVACLYFSCRKKTPKSDCHFPDLHPIAEYVCLHLSAAYLLPLLLRVAPQARQPTPLSNPERLTPTSIIPRAKAIHLLPPLQIFLLLEFAKYSQRNFSTRPVFFT